MTFNLLPLPYAYDALEPYMSQKTLEFHHAKHYSAYVSTLNILIKNTEFADRTLENIILSTDGHAGKAKIFNSAAQVWNHAFFWNCMKPGGGGSPDGFLSEKLVDSFGSFNQFAKEFHHAGVTQCGSGYVWLVCDRDRLKVITTNSAANPIVNHQVPLLVCDVWEHAYYLDFQNRCSDFLQTFLKHLVNWDFATWQLQQSQTEAVRAVTAHR